MLPDGDGFGVLDHLRSRRALDGVPLLFLSALADEEHQVRGLAAGADDYLTKPFSGVDVLARVDAACARAEERRRALEEQRLDFVSELHDGVAASLSRAALLLDARGPADASRRRVRGAEEAVREALAEVRAMFSLLDGPPTPWERVGRRAA